MDNTMYISLARQIQLFNKMDTVSTNVANANTAGYKSEALTFTDYMTNGGRGNRLAYSNDIGMLRNLDQGPLKSTGRSLDVAIQGDGFFVIDTERGARYTRAGSFTRNAVGEIITSQGDLVQGQGGGPIAFIEGDDQIRISSNGSVYARNNGLEEIRGQLNVVRFDDPRALVKENDTQFRLAEGQGEVVALEDEYRIAQGMLESSNVSSTEELTDLIKVSRSVTSTAGILNDLHQLTRDTVQRLSRQSQ